jgi:branched-chain amino acid aminotransferase
MGPEGEPGEITSRVKGWMADIMYGRVDHKWGVVINEKE